MKRYEYKVVKYYDYPDSIENDLTELGAQGWRIVQVTPNNHPNYVQCGLVFLERELLETAANDQKAV